MKVDRVLQKVMSAIQRDGLEKQQVAGQKREASNVPQKDDVRISDLIHNLNQSLSAYEMSIVRPEKVSVLKAEIDAGTYFVSGQAVAQKMLGMSVMTM
ncbi:MAG TPA: flagellar biosynthesis anti-sigma factor FlgM [Geobacteraceae bacterium]|jgi:flagellar biosynthesis anti-sigma factor FlgM|nr:flagellar biosynthesis anti-sigma factor FlgM [Geobacteraceae bacterium]